MSQAPAKELIDAFLTRINELDLDGGWSYLADLYDVIELHREQMRHAEWPAAFDRLEVVTYRIMLLDLEQRLGRTVPMLPRLANEREKFNRRFAYLVGLLQGFLGRAVAVSERLGGPQLH